MIMKREKQKKDEPTEMPEVNNAEMPLREDAEADGQNLADGHASANGQNLADGHASAEVAGADDRSENADPGVAGERVVAEQALTDNVEEESAEARSEGSAEESGEPETEDGFIRFITAFEATDFTGQTPLDFLRREVESGSAREVTGAFAVSLRESLLHTEGFIEGAGLPVAAVEEALQTLLSIASDMSRGVIRGESLKLIARGHSHPLDIELAHSQGVIEGRNARIVEEFRVAEDGVAGKGKVKDSIPRLGGTSSSPARSLSNSIFDLAREAQ